jgi:hypothetical protein
MEYYSAFKKGTLPFATTTTWMTVEDIVLSEISQAQKGQRSLICRLSFIVTHRSRK